MHCIDNLVQRKHKLQSIHNGGLQLVAIQVVVLIKNIQYIIKYKSESKVKQLMAWNVMNRNDLTVSGIQWAVSIQ